MALGSWLYLYPMKLAAIIRHLEQWAPPAYQESYDNSRLLTGNPDMEVTGVLVSLDCVESVIAEAVAKGCNVVVAHHPIVFGGLKSLTGRTYVERTVIQAIKNDVAIYAIHTNLDNVASGVNKKIADLIGLEHTRILAPVTGKLTQLEVICPNDAAEAVRNAAFEAGAGNLGNYKNGWFGTEGTSGFTAKAGAQPQKGQVNEAITQRETQLSFTFPTYLQSAVLSAVRKVHPYEEFDHKLTVLANSNQHVGSGMIGQLVQAENTEDFLRRIKATFRCGVVKHTAIVKPEIKTVALCGGAGFFLLGQAMGQGADVYITSDVKYHEFFDADGKIVLADIGHYESEQFTKELIAENLQNAFTGLIVTVNPVNTNPVNYL